MAWHNVMLVLFLRGVKMCVDFEMNLNFAVSGRPTMNNAFSLNGNSKRFWIKAVMEAPSPTSVAALAAPMAATRQRLLTPRIAVMGHTPPTPRMAVMALTLVIALTWLQATMAAPFLMTAMAVTFRTSPTATKIVAVLTLRLSVASTTYRPPVTAITPLTLATTVTAIWLAMPAIRVKVNPVTEMVRIV